MLTARVWLLVLIVGICCFLGSEGCWKKTPKPKISCSQKIANMAKSHEGSTIWSKASAHRVGSGKYKCNIFVAEVIEAACGKVPHRYFFLWSPIGAGEWGNPKSKHLKDSCWTVVKDPKPGDVTGDGVHCGIVTGDKQTTSAVEKKVVTNDWGFRDEQKGKITFWRYTCKCDKDCNTTTTESPGTTTKEPTTHMETTPPEIPTTEMQTPPPQPPMTTQPIVEETETMTQEVATAAPPSPTTPHRPYSEETTDESVTTQNDTTAPTTPPAPSMPPPEIPPTEMQTPPPQPPMTTQPIVEETETMS